MKRIKLDLILADRQAHKAADVILVHGQTESKTSIVTLPRSREEIRLASMLDIGSN